MTNPDNAIDKNSSKRLRGSRWKAFFQRVFFAIGVIATFLGIWEGVDHVREVIAKRSVERLEQTKLVHSKNKIKIEEQGQVTEKLIVADFIEVSGGNHSLPVGSIWIANRISLSDGATLTGSRIAFVAANIDGGRIDISGQNSALADASGSNGGDILIAAGRLKNVEVIARGGDGGSGRQGQAGTNGRDGNCAGFGGYRGASAGGNGGQGSPGGNGGDGGRIRIASEEISPVPTEPDYEGGKGGPGGPGGFGGRGGSGCTGLGGSQPNESAGNAGPLGSPGRFGNSRKPDLKTVSYATLLKIVDDRKDPIAIVDAISSAVF